MGGVRVLSEESERLSPASVAQAAAFYVSRVPGCEYALTRREIRGSLSQYP